MTDECFNELTIEDLKENEVQKLSKLISSDSLLEKLLPVQDGADAFEYWGTNEISGGDVDDETDDYLRCQFNSSKYTPTNAIIEISKLYPEAIFKLIYEVGENIGALTCQNGKAASIEYDTASEVEQLMNNDESLDEEDAQNELRDKLEDEIDKEWKNTHAK